MLQDHLGYLFKNGIIRCHFQVAWTTLWTLEQLVISKWRHARIWSEAGICNHLKMRLWALFNSHLRWTSWQLLLCTYKKNSIDVGTQVGLGHRAYLPKHLSLVVEPSFLWRLQTVCLLVLALEHSLAVSRKWAYSSIGGFGRTECKNISQSISEPAPGNMNCLPSLQNEPWCLLSGEFESTEFADW